MSIFTVGVYKSAIVRVAFPSRKATSRETRLCIATVNMLVPRLTRSEFFSHLRTFAVGLFATLVLTTAANAQTGIYVEFGGSKVDAPSNDWIYGPTFGRYHDFYPYRSSMWAGIFAAPPWAFRRPPRLPAA